MPKTASTNFRIHGLGRVHHAGSAPLPTHRPGGDVRANGWSLFVRLAHPKGPREALTNRALLLAGIAEKTRQDRLTITPMYD